MKSLRVVAVSLLFALGMTSLSAQQEWVKLGQAKVDGRADHDQIWVTGIRGDFTAVKLFVQNEGIEFDHVAVQYGDGTKDELSVRNFIKAGGETKVFDLEGNDRVIQKVDFYYRSNPNTKRKATVILYGRR